MNRKLSYIAVDVVLVTILLCLPINVRSQSEPIPADASQVNSWFEKMVGPIGPRKASLTPELSTSEDAPKIIKVNADGSGEFKTLTEAIKSVEGNSKTRVIIKLGPGNYTEKVRVERNTSLITLYGADPKNPSVLVFDGTAAKYTTMECPTLIVEGNYFTAINLKIVNSSPRPDGKMVGAQAVAMRIAGENAAFYNCQFHGFQDTLCDDKGKHFYKDCYVEGTVDFIFGSGQSIFLNTEIHVIPGDGMAMIAAHSRERDSDTNGYVFAHCKVTGTGSNAYLARSWFEYGRVIYAYCELGECIKPEGWQINAGQPKHKETVYFGEYNNKGPGAAMDKRPEFVKKLTDADVTKFLTLDYIEGTKWLLPANHFASA